MVIDLSGLANLGQGLAQAREQQRNRAMQQLQMTQQQLNIVNQLWGGAAPDYVIGPMIENLQKASRAAGIPWDLPAPGAGQLPLPGGATPAQPTVPAGVGAGQATGPFVGGQVPSPAAQPIPTDGTQATTLPATPGVPAQATTLPAIPGAPAQATTLPAGVGANQPQQTGPFASAAPPAMTPPIVSPGTAAGATGTAPAPTGARPTTWTDPKTGQVIPIPPAPYGSQTLDQIYANNPEALNRIRAAGYTTNVPINQLPDKGVDAMKYANPAYATTQQQEIDLRNAQLQQIHAEIASGEAGAVDKAQTTATGVLAGIIQNTDPKQMQSTMAQFQKNLPQELQARWPAILADAQNKVVQARGEALKVQAETPVATATINGVKVPITASQLITMRQQDRQFDAQMRRLDQADARMNAFMARADAAAARADATAERENRRLADQETDKRATEVINTWNSADIQDRPDGDKVKEFWRAQVSKAYEQTTGVVGYQPTGSLKAPTRVVDPVARDRAKRIAQYTTLVQADQKMVDNPQQFGFPKGGDPNKAMFPNGQTLAQVQQRLQQEKTVLDSLQQQQDQSQTQGPLTGTHGESVLPVAPLAQPGTTPAPGAAPSAPPGPGAKPGTTPPTPQGAKPGAGKTRSLADAKRKYPNVPEAELRKQLTDQGYTVVP